jgi:hypothetical protein
MIKTKARPPKPKGVLPDAKKIRTLREKSGKPLKEMFPREGLSLRTYQRAENGEAITAVALQEIANMYSVGIADVRAREDQESNTADGKEVFRLYGMAETGVNKIIEDFASGYCRIKWDFDINPKPGVADSIAQFIEKCEGLHPKQRELYCGAWDAAEKIRAIGALNQMLIELAESGVHVYAGRYNIWMAEADELKDLKWADTNIEVLAFVPSLTCYLKLTISERIEEYLTGTYSSMFSREQAYRSATERNIRNGIRPEWIATRSWAAFADPQYVASYKKAFQQTPPSMQRGVIDERGESDATSPI